MLKPVLSLDTVGRELLLVGINPVYETLKNEEGQFKKTDKIIRYDYEIVCVNKRFEKIKVKIEELKPLYPCDYDFENEQIMVEFENLTITPWINGKFISLSFKADKSSIVKES